MGLHPDASFWLPKECETALAALDWKQTDATPVPFDEYIATWAEEVVGFLPGPESTELGKEDLDALRSLLPSWKAIPTPHVCAFVLDGTITESFVKQYIIPSLLEKGSKWVIRYVYPSDVTSYDVLQGVSLCVFVGGEQTASKWSKLWALPKECCVVEFQQELQIDGEFQHLAHVAEFKSWVLLLSKGSVEDVQEQIQVQFGK